MIRRVVFYLLAVFCFFPAAGAPQQIRVVIDDNYPPYIFRDTRGSLQGILIDTWALWQQKTGVQVQINAMDWGKALDGMGRGEYDVIDTIFFTEERAKIFDYTKPYADIDVPIFFHKNISGIESPRSLKGFSVAVKKGDACISVLKNFGVTQLVEYDSYEEIIQGAADGHVMVFVVDKPAALYYLYKKDIHEQFRFSAPLYTGRFHRAVKKGSREMLRLVEDGFAKISPEEYGAIERKWFGTQPVITQRYMTYAAVCAGVVLLIFLTLIAWNHALQRNVRLKTAQLQSILGELRKSEEKYRSLFENLEDLFFKTDAHGIITMISPSIERILGYRPEEALGLSLYELKSVAPEDCGEMIERVKKDDVVRANEIKMHNKAGEELWVSISAHCNYDKDQNFIGFEGLARDITDRKKMEAELIKNQKLESLGVFAGGIAHDFNNILTGIVGNISLLKLQYEDDLKIASKLGEVEKASMRAKNLTQQLLTFAKGGAPIRAESKIAELIEETAKFVLSGSKTAFSFTAEEDLLPVFIDEGQIAQALTNIAVNAIQAMPDGGIFSAECCNVVVDEDNQLGLKAGTYVKTVLKDSGTGINAAYIERIFDPFFTTKAKGSGLGLATTYSIIKRHEGVITVSSEPSKGSIFTIYLPAAGTINKT